MEKANFEGDPDTFIHPVYNVKYNVYDNILRALTLSQYDIDWRRPLGSGSFGRVFKAVKKRSKFENDHVIVLLKSIAQFSFFHFG